MVDDASPPPGPGARLRAFWLAPVPLARIALLRIAIYIFTIGDLFWIVNDVIALSRTSPALYRPLLMREWLHLPAPNPAYVHTLRIVIIAGCLLCASGRLPRRLGVAVGVGVAAAFTDWVSIGMSYSKIDHDHFALIVALWVLPTVGTARLTGPGSRVRSEAAAWAVLCIQVGAVAVYFLSAWAKVRYGGWNWVTGSTFAWAVSRRGNGLARHLLDPPWILTAGQFGIFFMELSTPLLLFLRGRLRYAFVALLGGFHLTTYLTIKIHFLPLVICLLAFLPLEKIALRPGPGS
jgi:hypothetical protein